MVPGEVIAAQEALIRYSRGEYLPNRVANRVALIMYSRDEYLPTVAGS